MLLKESNGALNAESNFYYASEKNILYFFYQKMEPENDQLFCLFINFNFQERISTLKEKNSSSASKLDNYSLRQKLVEIEGTKRFDVHNK